MNSTLLAEALPDAMLRAVDADLQAQEALAAVDALPKVSHALQVKERAKRLKRMRAGIDRLVEGTTVPPEKVARYRGELVRFEADFEQFGRNLLQSLPPLPDPVEDGYFGVGARIATGIIE